MKIDVLIKTESQKIHHTIIASIRDLINYKNLEPGDKLPSERVLAEKFDVSRRNIKEAIATLEFYGLVVSIPQSGTFIADIGQVALNGMVDDILRLGNHNFKSLVETRVVLELKTVELAAERRTEEDLELIAKAHQAFKEGVLNGGTALEEDLLFHLAIARASGNTTMNALMLQITPKIIATFNRKRVCGDAESLLALQKHEAIFEAIKNKDAAEAVASMKAHFKMLIDFCETFDGAAAI